MVRRNRRDMTLDVLRSIHIGEWKPTRIMYKANLSWKTLHEILDTLVEKKLISVSKTHRDTWVGKAYKILPAGRQALIHNHNLSEALGEGN